MYCENCGAKNADDARFCGECGAPLQQEPSRSEETRRQFPQMHRPQEQPYWEQDHRDDWQSQSVFRGDEKLDVYGERLGENRGSAGRKKAESKANTTMILAGVITLLLLIAVAVGGVVLIRQQNKAAKEEDTELTGLINGDDEGKKGEEKADETTPTPTAEVTQEVTAVPTQPVTPIPTQPVTPVPTQPVTPMPPQPTEPPVQVPTVEYVSLPYGQSAPVTDFMFPYSSQQVLSSDQLATMEAGSVEEMHSRSQLAINEMLARYGFSFNPNKSDTSRDIYNRVSGLSWYQQAQAQCPYSDANTMIANMNSVERQNISLINEWQKQHGCYY